jgi:stearoyl-CoA desaturase (delta-9 desaturase)
MSSVPVHEVKVPEQAGDAGLPDVENYVSHMLNTTKARPTITWQNFTEELNWFNIVLLTILPVMGGVGACFTSLRWETALFSVFYYFYTGLGA